MGSDVTGDESEGCGEGFDSGERVGGLGALEDGFELTVDGGDAGRGEASGEVEERGSVGREVDVEVDHFPGCAWGFVIEALDVRWDTDDAGGVCAKGVVVEAHGAVAAECVDEVEV